MQTTRIDIYHMQRHGTHAAPPHVCSCTHPPASHRLVGTYEPAVTCVDCPAVDGGLVRVA